MAGLVRPVSLLIVLVFKALDEAVVASGVGLLLVAVARVAQ
jgi:hypothetical protein